MTADRAKLKQWRQSLTLDPLDPADPEERRYVHLVDAGTGAVDELYSLIDLALGTTAQLLSGPSGSGKTTELRRLAGRLQEAGYAVVMVDILSFVNQSSEVDITEFLIAVALAMDEELGAGADADEGDGWPARFRDFLKRVEVSVAVGPGSIGFTGEGMEAAVPGLSFAVDLKQEVKSSQPFVEELRAKLAFHLGDLRREVAAYCQDLVTAHVGRTGAAGVVMIVDSLEKVRGTAENDERVQESVKGLLVHHSDKLRFDSHHMVYTVPPYLLFTDPGLLPYDGSVRPVPIPHVRSREGGPVEQNVEQLTQVVAQRIPWRELLGSVEALRQVIEASGGHLRDLFTILQELIMLVNARAAPLPASAEQVTEAISKVALGFASITEEDAAFLKRVDAVRGDIRPHQHEVGQLARLLHTHMVLAHLDGGTWYEVHPLARRALGLA